MAGPTAGAAGGGYLIVATIRRPHGVKGELALALETDRPTLVFRKGRRLELGDERGRPIGGSLTVERARTVPDGLLLKAVEFGGRSPELEALRGRSLLIAAQEAAPAAPDELHYRDLIGAQVVVGAHVVGTVREITETAAGELLVLRREGGGELLIPFVRDWIRDYDAIQRRLAIEPPEGLLEL
jgi:16S rRNA processing protein RimM